MKVHADRAKCVSAGNCVAHAPEVFDQDEDDGSVILVDATPLMTWPMPSAKPPQPARRWPFASKPDLTALNPGVT